RRHDQARELGRDSLLRDHQRRQRPEHEVACLAVHGLPLLAIGVEVDLERVPLLVLPLVVEPLRPLQLGGRAHRRRAARVSARKRARLRSSEGAATATHRTRPPWTPKTKGPRTVAPWSARAEPPTLTPPARLRVPVLATSTARPFPSK